MLVLDLDPGPDVGLDGCCEVALCGCARSSTRSIWWGLPRRRGPRACSCTCRSTRRTTTTTPARLPWPWVSCWPSGSPSGCYDMDQGQAHRQGLHRLVAEHPPQDHHHAVLHPGQGPADGVHPDQLGRTRRRRGRAAHLRHRRRARSGRGARRPVRRQDTHAAAATSVQRLRRYTRITSSSSLSRKPASWVITGMPCAMAVAAIQPHAHAEAAVGEDAPEPSPARSDR